jgi:hypothetical protein
MGVAVSAGTAVELGRVSRILLLRALPVAIAELLLPSLAGTVARLAAALKWLCAWLLNALGLR